MAIEVKQVVSLEKICPNIIGDLKTVTRKTLMGGEYFSYQIVIRTDKNREFKVHVSSKLKEYIRLYAVKNVIMDLPTDTNDDEDLITKKPGIMPDLLMPLEYEDNVIRLENEAGAIWVEVKIPENCTVGEYSVTVTISYASTCEMVEISQTLILDVIGINIPKHKTIFTQWFHVDCIADVHNVDIYSEEHWRLIDQYMHLASELGVNMILTPIITPPLDTYLGTTRPCTQLVKIRKSGKEYHFDFSLLKRWINICNKNHIKYLEMSHLFSQWGLQYAPNIVIEENEKEDYLFGWHISAESKEYKEFLEQFLPALMKFCKSEGVKDRCWFHISDEPNLIHLPAYQYAYNIIKPLIEDCPMLDAISNYEFYEKGLIQIPVTVTSHIEQFLAHNVKNQWVYYCGNPHDDTGNRFLAMPSYRNRILGLQMYKYNIQGFLHWGYNFYYSEHSRKKINPYVTSSADKGFPSGDAFSVYPINTGAVPSLRAIVFRDALYDIEICRMLEGLIGRDEVIRMIDEAAGMKLTFSEYPRNINFIPDLIEEMEQKIKEYV